MMADVSSTKVVLVGAGNVATALALALAASYLGRRALNMVGRFMTSGFWPVGVVSPSL